MIDSIMLEMTTKKMRVVVFLICRFLLHIKGTFYNSHCFGICVRWNIYCIILTKIVVALNEVNPVMRTYWEVSSLFSSAASHWL